MSFARVASGRSRFSGWAPALVNLGTRRAGVSSGSVSGDVPLAGGTINIVLTTFGGTIGPSTHKQVQLGKRDGRAVRLETLRNNRNVTV